MTEERMTSLERFVREEGVTELNPEEVFYLTAEVRRLRVALREFAEHSTTCDTYHGDRFVCTCGLAAALEE